MGAEFGKLALAPGQSTGNYQKVVDRVFPPLSPLYMLPTPTMVRGRGRRDVRDIPMNPLHEAIARETKHDPHIVEAVPSMEWPSEFLEHPLVVEARSRGKPWPIPLAIYLDGVRFTAPLAGRSDSILGVWAYTGATPEAPKPV